MKIAIIGAGPAGLFAAIEASTSGEVDLYEKKPRPGRKFLITGAGQCNLTHRGDPADFLPHYRGNSRFLRNSLYGFPPQALLAFFEERGIPFASTPEGKFFPKDRKAVSLLGVLEQELENRGVKAYYNAPVESLEKEGDSFVIRSPRGTDRYDRVIITTGGMSYPVTGSQGDGYKLASSLGHKVIPPKPALVDMHIRDFALTPCSGESFKGITLGLWREGKKVMDITGDLLITHQGFSGPVILNNSRFMQKGDALVPRFYPLPEELDSVLQKKLHQSPKKSYRNILKELSLPGRFVDLLVELSGITGDCSGAQVTKGMRKEMVRQLTNHPYVIARSGGWDKAMVTAGGIDLSQVNPKTMESRVCPGLFFAGEVLDIDGDTGGYNLQAAFSTAYLAACSQRL